MSAILEFDFQKRKQLRFSKSKLSKLHKKPNFACDNYIFPKTRGNKNKQWTYSTPVNFRTFCCCKLNMIRTYRKLFLSGSLWSQIIWNQI